MSSELAQRSNALVGEYLCTVAEKASIERLHLEGSEPPTAMLVEDLPIRFKIAISAAEANGLRLIELPYSGPDRDPREWHTENSVLHGPYLGNAEGFRSFEYDEAFFVINQTIHANSDGEFEFYHSGFEWAGGEDTFLSIRWGRCKKS